MADFYCMLEEVNTCQNVKEISKGKARVFQSLTTDLLFFEKQLASQSFRINNSSLYRVGNGCYMKYFKWKKIRKFTVVDLAGRAESSYIYNRKYIIYRGT